MEKELASTQFRTHRTHIRTVRILATAIAAVCAISEAKAQSARPSSTAFEEIVVTARRRSEDIQKVPIAITVVTPQVLQNSNIQSVGDLQYLSPSLSSGSRSSRDAMSLNIRGQGTSVAASQPGVILYLNEVPLPVNQQGETIGGPGLLFDLEHVEILKGPQGTLFGRNSVGGAILVRSALPKNGFGGRLQVGYGNYNNKEFDGMINLPVVPDKLLVRAAANVQKRDGFTRVLGSPSHPNGFDSDRRDNWSIRGTIEFRANDRFKTDTIVTYSEFDSNGNPFFLDALAPGGGTAGFLFPGFTALLAQQQALGPRTALPVNEDLYAKGSTLSASNTTNFELNDNITLRNILGYTLAKQTFVRDPDATIFPVIASPFEPHEAPFKQYTEEFQVQGNGFDKRLTWIIGGFYLNQPKPKHYSINTLMVFGGRSDNETRISEKSKAVFAQGTYEIISGLKFTAGLRQTWDDRFKSQHGGTFGTVCTGVRVGCDTAIDTRAKTDALTWTFGLDYQVNPSTLVYFTSRRGYRAGGYNVLPTDPIYNPEYVQDFELGTKSDWSIGGVAIRTNADVYYEKYTDIQVQQNQFINNTFTTRVANAASGKFYGLEFESIAQLAREFQIGATFDYLNFEVSNLGPGVDPNQLKGGKLADRPKYKYSLTAQYRLPIPADLGDLSLEAKWHWQSRTQINYTDTASAASNNFAPYGLLSLSATWEKIAGKPFDLTFYASNVTDKVYKISGATLLTGLGFTFVQYGEPRMYGFRLRYRFGSEG